MCGICGAISGAPIDPELIGRMRDRMVHRGPDHGGTWLAEDSRVCLGHRRLAIVDLTSEANQPFISHDGRFVITFNGRVIKWFLSHAVASTKQPSFEHIPDSKREHTGQSVKTLAIPTTECFHQNLGV